MRAHFLIQTKATYALLTKPKSNCLGRAPMCSVTLQYVLKRFLACVGLRLYIESGHYCKIDFYFPFFCGYYTRAVNRKGAVNIGA